MNSFKDCGFLSEALASELEKDFKAYAPLYQICLELSRYAWQLQDNLAITNTNLTHLTAATLYARTLTLYQSIMIITPKGMKQEIKVLTRCLLEPLFPLVAISKDDCFAKKYVLSDLINQKKKLRHLLDLHQQFSIENLNSKIIQKELKIIENKIKDKKAKKITVFDSAQAAGLKSWYKTLYAHMSDTLHASPSSLEELMTASPDRTKVKSIKNLPDFSEHNDILTTAAESIYYAIISICKIFKLETPNEVEKLHEKVYRTRTALLNR